MWYVLGIKVESRSILAFERKKNQHLNVYIYYHSLSIRKYLLKIVHFVLFYVEKKLKQKRQKLFR